MLRPWPSHLILRQWQQEFLDKYNVAELRDFLLVATPGAGKTVASLKVAHNLSNSGTIERVIVVCPTDHLRTQWLEDATRVHIHLDKLQLGKWSRQIALTDDFVGMVLTYAQVVNNQELLRGFTHKYKTLVIFDEIHHNAEGERLTWGLAARQAFDPAARRLLLSGTPYRSDNNPIPFVRYNVDPNDPKTQRAEAHYNYSYGDALKDENVVRHIVFPAFDGRLIWQNFGEKKEASFKHHLGRAESGYRLRTALHPEGDWIKDVIKAADDKLNFIRQEEGHSTAGGLIVASDQEHAKAYARLLKEITGEECTLAISDSEDASKAIAKFRTSTQKWIVAVKMVSEGVDIKRLRVGIYATNTLTTTFFRQVIGRVIRWDDDPRWQQLDDQTAYFYLPEDERLVNLAQQIRVEITDTIREQEIKEFQPREGAQLSLDDYEFGQSDAEESNHYFNGESFTLSEMQEAAIRLAYPLFNRLPSAALAFAWRRLKQELEGMARPSTDVPQTPQGFSPQPVYLQKQSLKSLVNRKVARLVHVCQQQGIVIPGVRPYGTIHNAWGRFCGYSHQSTNDDLQGKLTWLEGLINRALQGDGTITSDLR